VDSGRLLGRGIAFPPRIGRDGRWAWSVGAVNVREAVRIILLTDLRERLMLPQFGGGIRQFLFEPNTPATRQSIAERITRALGAWEPRMQIENVTVEEDLQDRQTALVSIAYTLVATQNRERVTLSVSLIG
jgi:uncharacterized protein